VHHQADQQVLVRPAVVVVTATAGLAAGMVQVGLLAMAQFVLQAVESMG
jgi:hypothetical protein